MDTFPAPGAPLLFGPTSIVGYALASNSATLVPVVTSSNPKAIERGWLHVDPEDDQAIGALCSATSGPVIYAHAVCDVAKCEAHPDWAYEKNVENLLRVLRSLSPDIRFVYISSDHVFGEDGEYDEASDPCPISNYGRSRVEAERIVLNRHKSLVVRVPLAIGPSLNGRTGHLDWMRYRFTKGLPITIVEDEARSALWADDAASRAVKLAASTHAGIRHLWASRVSRPDLADAVIGRLGLPIAYNVADRAAQRAPHLGRVALTSRYRDELSLPLPSAVKRLAEPQGIPRG